jgi:hypothetical protein
MSEYTKQAEDFLKKTGVTFITEFISHRPYFAGETESRDVYMILLKRGSKSISFLFGQSIANKGKHPEAYDVLAGLDSQIYDTFKEFCDEFGYDSDSMKAHEIWISVNELAKKLQGFFNEQELEALSNIQ